MGDVHQFIGHCLIPLNPCNKTTFSFPTARLIHLHVKAVERLNEIGQWSFPDKLRGLVLTYYVDNKAYKKVVITDIRVSLDDIQDINHNHMLLI